MFLVFGARVRGRVSVHSPCVSHALLASASAANACESGGEQHGEFVMHRSTVALHSSTHIHTLAHSFLHPL
jgi:hypothetical protein